MCHLYPGVSDDRTEHLPAVPDSQATEGSSHSSCSIFGGSPASTLVIRQEWYL